MRKSAIAIAGLFASCVGLLAYAYVDQSPKVEPGREIRREVNLQPDELSAPKVAFSRLLADRGWNCGKVLGFDEVPTARRNLSAFTLRCLETVAEGQGVTRSYVVTMPLSAASSIVRNGTVAEGESILISAN